MKSVRRYTWSGHARGEGGPLLVADLEDYLVWGGAHRNWTEDAVYVVHSYGPLVSTLPPRFQPQGPEEWHQNARISTLAAAQAYVQELSRAVSALEPLAVQRAQLPMNFDEFNARLKAASAEGGDAYRVAANSWRIAWRDHREQGIDFNVNDERVLHVDVKPDTDYARGCDAMTDGASRISFGSVRSGVLWDLEGEGTADVAMTEDRSEFLLLTTLVNMEADEQEARAHVVNSPAEERIAEIEFPSGSVVVVWATVRASDHVDDVDPGTWLRAAAQQEPPVQLSTTYDMPNVGTILRVSPGNYQVACGVHNTKNGSCRWVRFSRLEK